MTFNVMVNFGQNNNIYDVLCSIKQIKRAVIIVLHSWGLCLHDITSNIIYFVQIHLTYWLTCTIYILF